MSEDLKNPRDSSPAPRVFGLRLKFVILFSIILVMTCSSLSWYFIETRRQAMTDNLEELGAILLTNVVRNDHFRIAGVVLEDPVTLNQFVHSLMAIDHVVYVVITASDGRILDRQSKRTRKGPSISPQRLDEPLYPDDRITTSLLQAPLIAPFMTQLVMSSEQTLVPHNESTDWLLPFLVREETLFDFTMPVLRNPSTDASLPQHPFDFDEKPHSALSIPISPVVGLVRLGITDAPSKQGLLIIVRNVSFLTVFIILVGILGAHLLTSRITTPLRKLANAAQQLATGNVAPVALVASTTDEIGELTSVFNAMTLSLYDRNRAITMNLDTIRRQVTQLTTVHQASTAIASAGLLEKSELLDTVLHLLVDNLGFSRMTVFMWHPERNCASVARITGVSSEIEEAMRQIDIPVADNGGITAELLLHGKPVLVPDIDTVAHRMYSPILEMARRSDVRSFIAVPLLSHAKILGFLAGDRGIHKCSEEDLDILRTIAGHVAAAIDNAQAYSNLAELTQYQEQRIEERTQELSRANEQLQVQDQRRSKYVKIVSHELRTPMTAIRSFSENMLDGITGPLTELQRTYLNRIQHNVARLVRLAEELLDWLRLDGLRLEEVCVEELATIVADSLETVASDKQVSLTVTRIGHTPLIQGDRDKIEQILWNLIGNAIKFTPPGGRVSVEFCVSPPGFVQTCVSDTGCGIDTVHLPNIFEEFSEVPSPMPASQGAQLGLSITKTLVSRHHGRLWAESELEYGSRFYFTLPISGPHYVPNEAI